MSDHFRVYYELLCDGNGKEWAYVDNIKYDTLFGVEEELCACLKLDAEGEQACSYKILRTKVEEIIYLENNT